MSGRATSWISRVRTITAALVRTPRPNWKESLRKSRGCDGSDRQFQDAARVSPNFDLQAGAHLLAWGDGSANGERWAQKSSVSFFISPCRTG